MKNIWSIAIMVGIAEFGCMIRSAALTIQYGESAVFWGTMLGTAVSAIIGIWLGVLLSRLLPEYLTNWMAGFILILVGAYVIVKG